MAILLLAAVGEKEKVNHTVNVRMRDNKEHVEQSLATTLEQLRWLQQQRAPRAQEDFQLSVCGRADPKP